ncbi:MAG: MFS transporter [Rhodospirillaceae bacterium]|jgi:MFS family permease|nr:MFS transporter [Rhodospirillaceae bacterium]MBT5566071.1 MFS transporter [Rhodospirillaceae bacterium]MBT6090015.1 MFS transporter [Rhodospirillaceae bacterium]MBT6960801.1 MFS transporter [Rhodospirillaceae bacterium]
MLTAPQEFQRGWRTLLACSVGNGFGLSGFAFYTFGVFVIPLVDAFGWTRGEVSAAASFLLLGTVFTAPIVGTIVDKFGAKRVGLISMGLLAIGYASLTQLGGGIAFFYAMWLAMSLVGGGTTPVVWTRAVNLWFDKGRGLALGLALAGSGLAGIIGPGAVTALIERYGWQAGYLGISALILIVALPLIGLLFNDNAPSQNQTEQVDEPATHAGLTFQESYRTVVFWKIAIGFFFISAIIAGLLINLVPLLIDRDMTAMAAAKIAGVLGFSVLFGRIGVGFLIDHFRAPLVAAVMFSATAIGCLLLTLDSAPTWVVYVAVITLGLSAAAEIDLVAFLVSRFFGLKAYGKIYGSQLSVFYLGAAAGPLAIGMSFDMFGGYQQALYAGIVILLFGAIVIGGLGKPRDFPE